MFSGNCDIGAVFESILHMNYSQGKLSELGSYFCIESPLENMLSHH